MALKHRQNKAQRQRIIIFTCSPVLEDEKKLIQLAQKIKKNSISIDFVVFGELNGKVESKLTVFNENVEGGARSHIAIMSPQSGLLSDQLVISPILNGDGGSGPGGMGDTSEGRYGREFEFGIDPSVDPELALALRMSIEDEEPQPPLDNEAEAGGSKDSCSR